MINDIDYEKCMCRKSKNSDKQCQNFQKYGDYCGIHIKCHKITGRIDKPKVNNIDIYDIDHTNYKQYLRKNPTYISILVIVGCRVKG